MRKFKTNSKCIRFVMVCVVLLLGLVVYSDRSVYGDKEGGGSDTGGTSANCSNNAYQALCGDPAGSAGGGASWKIFKADDASGLDDDTSYGGSILQTQYKGEAMEVCKDEGWFASFGWDGMYGSAYGYSNFSFQIGPANRTSRVVDEVEQNIIREAAYNNYDTKDSEYLYDNDFPNNTRISSATAEELYKVMHKDASGIPDSIGYFCFAPKRKIEVYAKVANNAPGGTKAGDYLNRGNQIYGPVEGKYGDPIWLYSDKWTVPKGYTFAHWGLTNGFLKNSSYTDTNVQWKSLTTNRLGKDESDPNKAIDVYYYKDTFAGRSRVGPSGSSLTNKAPNNNTGITTGSAQYDYYCTTTNCKVQFAHDISRIYGGGQTKYTITRRSNVPGVSSGDIVKNVTTSIGSNNNLTAVRTSDEYTLGYGQVVCETLVFNSTTTSSPTRATTMVCAHGPNKAPATSGIAIDVKNDSVVAYNSYQDVVYAKPGNLEATTDTTKGDALTYQAVYNPWVQSFADDYAQKMIINGRGICTSAYNTYLTSKISSSFYSPCGGGVWANGFRVFSANFSGTQFGNNYTYRIGNTDPRTETNNHTVVASEVGYSLDETALTNSSDGVSTVPKSAGTTTECMSGPALDENGNTFKDEDGNVVQVTYCYSTVRIDKSQMKDDTAHARVPYNFENSTRMTTCNAADAATYGMTCENYPKSALYSNLNDADNSTSKATLYAGEDFTFHFDTITSPKWNKTTDGTYATIVRKAQIKLQFCLNNECDNEDNYQRADRQTTPTESNGTIKDLNDKTGNNANVKGTVDSPEDKSITMNIPDAPAGTKMCVRSAVYPANSGDETNYADREGSRTWAYSEPACFTIAKKPSIQVWGGNVYSSGAIATLDSNKKLLDGYDAYRTEGGSIKNVFGSWGELGVFANGKITSFGSGASMGYGGNNGGTLSPNPFTSNTAASASNPGGSSKSGICYHSPLTFANFYLTGCIESQVGNMGDTVTAATMDGDKEGVLVKYDYDDGGNYGTINSGDLSDASRLKGGIAYYYAGTDINVGSAGAVTVEKKTIQIVRASNNITISNNIEYDKAGGYNKLSDVPKLILYADKDIKIGCGVTRIDAVLIAEGTVSTCVDEAGHDPSLNSGERSQGQLVINGAVIAAKLKPLRTYGSATGANSIIPAEIINFDPTLYRWGGEDPSSSSDSEDGEESSVETSIDLDVTYQRELAPRL